MGWNTGCHSGDKFMWSSTPCGDSTRNSDSGNTLEDMKSFWEQDEKYIEQNKGFVKHTNINGGMYWLVNQAKCRAKKDIKENKQVLSENRKWGDLWRSRKLLTNQTSSPLNHNLSFSFNASSFRNRRLGGCVWSNHLHKMVCPESQDGKVDMREGNVRKKSVVETTPLLWNNRVDLTPQQLKRKQQQQQQIQSQQQNRDIVKIRHTKQPPTQSNILHQTVETDEKFKEISKEELEKLTAYVHTKRDDLEKSIKAVRYRNVF